MPDTAKVFFSAMEARLKRYDLLKHPYYQAWTNGELTREDLREYASEYWHHVSAFPTYLSALHSNLPDGELRRMVLKNLVEEEGLEEGAPHSDLWMDFACGMGAETAEVRSREIGHGTSALIEHYRAAMLESPAAAMAALYAYESRVPAIARTKAEGLEQHYGADDATRRYFTLHVTADVEHTRVWHKALAAELEAHPEETEGALDSAEAAARALWNALDGVENARRARMAAAA